MSEIFITLYSTLGARIDIGYTYTQNVANNTTTLTVKAYVVRLRSDTVTWVGSPINFNLTVNGTTTTHGWTFDLRQANLNQRYLITTATRTITHNADGTRANVSASVYCATGTAGLGTISGSTNTISIPTIPRASAPTLNVSTQAIGSAITISTNRASTAFTHTLKYSFGSVSANIATGVGASTSWTLPSSLANQIPNATSGTGSIICETYNGSTLIGTRTVSFTATVPNNATYNPTVSIALSGNNLLSGNYVQGRSTVTVTLTAASKFSGTIASRSTTVKAGSTTISSSGANSFTSGVLTSSGTITVATTVTDSRGRTATASSTFTVQPYSAPAITAFNAFRANSDGTANPSGTHIRVTGTASISPINNSNSRSTLLRSRATGTTTWTSQATNTTSYTPSLAATFSAAVNSSFEVEIVSTDAFNTTTRRINVGTTFTLMNFGASGGGVGIGKVHEQGVLDIGGEVFVSGKVSALKGLSFTDNRSVESTPQIMPDKALSLDFKFNTAVGSPPVSSSATYSHIINVAGWGSNEGSGGWPAQLSIGDGIAVRQATSATAWRDWRTVWHDGNDAGVTWVDDTSVNTPDNASSWKQGLRMMRVGSMSGTGYPAIGTVVSARRHSYLGQTLIGNDNTMYYRHSNTATGAPLPWLRVSSVEEEGSNTHGRYIKYSDGTMVCYHYVGVNTAVSTVASGTIAVRESGNLAWSYPSGFAEEPAVFVTVNFDSDAVLWTSLKFKSTSWIRYRIVSNASYNAFTATHMRVAIGRWK